MTIYCGLICVYAQIHEINLQLSTEKYMNMRFHVSANSMKGCAMYEHCVLVWLCPACVLTSGHGSQLWEVILHVEASLRAQQTVSNTSVTDRTRDVHSLTPFCGVITCDWQVCHQHYDKHVRYKSVTHTHTHAHPHTHSDTHARTHARTHTHTHTHTLVLSDFSKYVTTFHLSQMNLIIAWHTEGFIPQLKSNSICLYIHLRFPFFFSGSVVI